MTDVTFWHWTLKGVDGGAVNLISEDPLGVFLTVTH